MFFMHGFRAKPVSNALRSAHRCRHQFLPTALAIIVLALLGSNAAAQSVTESFTYQGRMLLYRYTLDNLPASGRQPGLLLYFHGHNTGSQEDLLYLSPSKQSIADTSGLVYVKLASPALRNGTLGGSGTRHWHDEDIAVVHEFLQTELPSKFSFDSNRIVFWGASQGTCFLNDFVVKHGTSYGGGLYAQCGCFNLSRKTRWETPPDFKNRFKVLVQATTGDFLYGPSVNSYWFYKYWIGLDTFADLSEAGGHCSGRWTVGDEDAIKWILGTKSLPTGSAGDRREPELPLRLAERREPEPGGCHGGGIIMERRGDGSALWWPIQANGGLEIAPRNAEAYFEISTITGSLSGTAAGVAADEAGHAYVASFGDGNHWIRRIDPAGVIQTIAGTGEAGFLGDGGPATEGRLNYPIGVAVDAAGNVYVADSRNNRIRRIDASGMIETIAGNGERGYSGDGGPASEARLREPRGVALDEAGNVYVADTFNHRVRRIDASGTIETIAGNGEWGYSGDGGPASEARLRNPKGWLWTQRATCMSPTPTTTGFGGSTRQGRSRRSQEPGKPDPPMVVMQGTEARPGKRD